MRAGELAAGSVPRLALSSYTLGGQNATDMTGCHFGLLWSVQESWLADCRYDKISVYRSGSCTALSRMENPSSPVFLEIHKSTGWLLYVMDPCFLNSAEKGKSPGFFFFFMHKEYQILSICASCKENAVGTGQQDRYRSAVPNRNSPGSLSIPSIHSSTSTAPLQLPPVLSGCRIAFETSFCYHCHIFQRL